MAKEFSYENMAKGFTNTLKSWIDTIGERNKLMVDQISNEQKMRSNFFYKILEQNMERQNKLKFIKEAQGQFGQGNQEDGITDINAPQMEVSATGEPGLKYPSGRDKEFNIKLGLNRIALKEKKFAETGDERFNLNPQEQKFKEDYSGMVTARSIADPSGLSTEQQIQARALSRKIYGVRGAEFGLPAVYEEMRKGKSIDEIEDSLRYSTQSKEFTGDIRNATQSILMNTSEDKSQKAMDYIDDLLSKGNKEGAKNQLKRLARTQAGMEEQRAIIGKERTIKLLDEIQDDLNNLERSGVNTNIFTGTAEEVASKIGTVISPEARKIATKIAAAVQNYRRSMTGVQFGMPENKEYKAMFPNIGRTANFNSANISGLKEVMTGDLDNFYSLAMGENEYRNIFEQPITPRMNNISNQQGQRIKVKSPDGRIGSIPQEQLQDALTQGYMQVQ